ncbi:cytidylate kinase family protein [Candidatus Woesearchaeota archaeon]|nr:cytidylate kinase family protein [Candidatus Woesearchaeota archaeon]
MLFEIYTISGTPGSGKSTVAKILEQKTNYHRIHAGGIFRKELYPNLEYNPKSLPFEEWYSTLPSDFLDREVDSRMASVAREKSGLILEGRMVFNVVPKDKKALHIYLKCDPKIAAMRIFHQSSSGKGREEESKYVDEKEVFEKIEIRTKAEQERYKKIYGVDVQDMKHYNIVIDTTNISPEDVVEIILLKSR